MGWRVFDVRPLRVAAFASIRVPAGRILDPECFKVNPGTFHLAVVNQLGIAGRSLVSASRGRHIC